MIEQPDLTWRRATESDTDELAALEPRLFGDSGWPRAVVHDELTGPYRRYTVIERGNQIVGYGGVLVVGRDGDVQTIALSPELRGQGIGQMLLDRLLADAQSLGAQQVFLEVRADNAVAISLYERSAFEHIGVRRGYYQPGNVDAMMMRRDLRAHPAKDER